MLTPRQLKAKQAVSAYFRGPSVSAAAVGRSIEPGPISEDIIGWGIGAKIVDGTVLSGESTVRVYVRELLPNQRFPHQFGDLPTDVVAVGQIVAYQDLHRPTPCGVSAGHPDVTAGTLGCLVERDGNHYILSNNHVLANSNAAREGDPVIQPCSADGGTLPDDRIATLEPYQEIDFTGRSNDIDAAIALVGDCNQDVVSPEIIDIGRLNSTPRTAMEGQTVRKYGRTTGHTTGVVSDISGDFWVNYGDGTQNLRAWFENQIVVKNKGSSGFFSQGGDSGSLIVDAETRDPVALLFAGSEDGEITIANPIKLVLQHYGVTVVGQEE